ncbi:hypothetical protein JCM16776_1410 [Leptotrichia shahii]|uniref:Autotransporter beta-domain protein n=1 Tax=Leptotrichia shahii TaxID=157691 RepID=A0A510JPD8_9FUSO|nr:autotransporter-associated N-terminal domain-containing protein [Leptotrichia shahii]BBM41188.1 hypothetical protein JCM16776_1410 [Leptotrichia shahii]
MTNSITKIKQDLRAYAKRCKDVHYTEGLVITFLITGMLFAARNLFSASAGTSIENQKQAISTSIKTIHQQVKATRKENDKLLKSTNLELIQLMEQGDHVVKAPWSSWQYGINYMNNNWNGTYKGRGDKKAKYPYEGVYQRSLDIYERSVSPDSSNYGLLSRNRRPNSASGSAAGYGVASFKPVKEPIVPFEVNAGIRPRQVVKERIAITAPTFTTPTAPETISFVPANPSVSINATPPTAPQSVSAPGTGNGPESYLLKNTGGVWDWQAGQSPYYTASDRATVALASEMSMDQLGGTRAELNYHVGGNVEFKNATLTSAGDTTGTGWPFTPTNYTVSGFNGYAIIKNVGNADIEIKNTDINYTGTGGSGTSSRWLFHTDAHNSSRTSAWTIDDSTRININGTQLMMYTSQLHHGDYNATFTNNGKVNEAGNKNVIWLALNERASVNRRTETFTNAGEITLNGTNGIFAYIDMPTTLNTGTWVGVPGVAPTTGNGDTDANSNAWVLTNSGKLTLNGSGNTGVFVSDSFRYWAAEIQLTNADNFKVDGTGNAGVYFKGWADLDGGATQNNGTAGTSTTSASTFNMSLTGTGNTGIYFNYAGDDSEPDTKKHTFKLTGTSTVKSSNKDNILIYNANGDVDLSNAITLNPNGKSNVGIYNKSADKLVTAAKITGTGESATGIYSTGTGYTKNDGTITMTGEKVKGIVAGDSTNVGTAIIHNTGNVTVKGKEAVAVIAQKGGTVNLPYIDPVTNVKAGTPIITTEGQSALGLYATTNGIINAVDTTVNASGGAINVYKNGGNIKLKNSTLNTNADSLAFMTGGSGKIDFTSTDVTTANINSKGTAFYYDGSTSAGPTGYADFSNTGIQTWASNSFDNLNKLKLNMTASDSRMFIASQVKMNLADTNLTPANVASLFGSNSPQITGVTDYKTFLLYKSLLTIANTDTVDLDNHTEPYNLLEISNSSITNNGKITGTKAGQYAMAQTDDTNNASGTEWVKLINNGTISLSGSGSTGIYAQAGEITNNGTVTVGDSSAGIYAVENTKVDNQKDITVGSKSTGIFYTDIFKDPVTGVVTTYTTTTPLKNTGKITLSGNDSVGMTYETDNIGSGAAMENTGTIIANGDRSIALYAKTPKTSGSYTTTNSGTITMGDSAKLATPNVALYTDATKAGVTPLKNTGKITVGNNALGIYGYESDNSGDITVGKGGIGIYSQGGNINLTGGTIKTGEKSGNEESVGVYTVGNGQTVTNSGTAFDFGKDSFGFVNVGTSNKIYSNVASTSLKDNNVYIYSNDTKGTVVNNTNITSGAGAQTNYGIYSAGTVTNNANIDLSSGVGSVAIYSIKGGTATNNATITVGASDVPSSSYSIGMGAGYSTTDTGNIVNRGTINVNGKYGIGMYASGAGSTATNDGNIVLNASNTTGIYADNGATAINNKSITTGSGTYTNAVGVYLGKDSKLINNKGATININAKNGVGVYLKGGTVANYGTITVNGASKTNDNEVDGNIIYQFTVPETGRE